MPRRKPITSIRRHYSNDLKEHIVYQLQTLGYSSSTIAVNLDISLRVVQRVKKVFAETGKVCEDRAYMGRSPSMSMNAIEVIILSTH